MAHISVLLHEVIENLAPREGGVFVDATFGGGGHSLHLAEKIGKTGMLISFDADGGVFTDEIIERIRSFTNFTHVNRNFREIGTALQSHDGLLLDGALFDLGLSSTQLEESGRGFSFQRNEPLRMTFKRSPIGDDVTAETVVNDWSADTIATILHGFGDEQFATAIAKGIVMARENAPITTTAELVEVIRKSTPVWYQHGRTHFATRTFQAIRMAVNDELGAIETAIHDVLPYMKTGGKIAIISFHSIEDRLVKQYFRKLASEERISILTKRPIVPSDNELKHNPRARSAKLRIIEKL